MSAVAITEAGIGDVAVLPDRMRRLRPEVVDELAESMATRGMIEPIGVRPASGRGGYCLIAGWHRFEAAKQLKWPSIAAIVLDSVDADAALLVEIDENLIRAELSPAERALHLRERKRLYEAFTPKPKRARPGRADRSRALRHLINRHPLS